MFHKLAYVECDRAFRCVWPTLHQLSFMTDPIFEGAPWELGGVCLESQQRLEVKNYSTYELKDFYYF